MLQINLYLLPISAISLLSRLSSITLIVRQGEFSTIHSLEVSSTPWWLSVKACWSLQNSNKRDWSQKKDRFSRFNNRSFKNQLLFFQLLVLREYRNQLWSRLQSMDINSSTLELMWLQITSRHRSATNYHAFILSVTSALGLHHFASLVV